jgi:hypothetical protein
MHAGEPEAPLVGEERGDAVTGFVSGIGALLSILARV